MPVNAGDSSIILNLGGWNNGETDIRGGSSVGKSTRLIYERSWVQAPLTPLTPLIKENSESTNIILF